MKSWNLTRLTLLAALLLFSSLAFWSADNLWLFKGSLIATEYGAYFILPCLVLCILPPRRSESIALGIVAMVMFSSTEFRAWHYRQSLPQQFQMAFGAPWDSASPTPTYTIRKQTFTYDSVQFLEMSFWRPKGLAQTPCLIVLHGGGWDGGSRDEFEAWNKSLAQEGIAVASIDYRLAPNDPWPAQLADVMKAKAWLTLQAKGLNIDPSRFALLGRSAGAQIALSAAYKNPKAFDGVVSFYAPADLRFAWTYSNPHDMLDSLKLLAQYTGGTLQEKPEVYENASPYADASKDSPPTLLLHGMMDRMVWNAQSDRLDQKLDQMGQTKHLFISLPWAVHEFDYNMYGPGGRIAHHAVEAFLKNIFHLNEGMPRSSNSPTKSPS